MGVRFEETAKKLPWGKGARVLKVDEGGLLAVEKPTGVMSHPNRRQDEGKALLRAPYDGGEQAYVLGEGGGPARRVWLLNRLDSATSGIVLLALDKAVAAAVLGAFAEKQVEKIYQALVFGAPLRKESFWKDRLRVAKSGGRLRAEAGKGGLGAETRVLGARRVSDRPPVSLLTLSPITGRTHQLRIQASKRQLPIVGDRTYGDFAMNKAAAQRWGIRRLCLHCVETKVVYLLGSEERRFAARTDPPFRTELARLR